MEMNTSLGVTLEIGYFKSMLHFLNNTYAQDENRKLFKLVQKFVTKDVEWAFWCTHEEITHNKTPNTRT